MDRQVLRQSCAAASMTKSTWSQNAPCFGGAHVPADRSPCLPCREDHRLDHVRCPDSAGVEVAERLVAVQLCPAAPNTPCRPAKNISACGEEPAVGLQLRGAGAAGGSGYLAAWEWGPACWPRSRTPPRGRRAAARPSARRVRPVWLGVGLACASAMTPVMIVSEATGHLGPRADISPVSSVWCRPGEQL
ncbi:hypothetical protein HBB16_17930 [Pseudonocardia sp. MCCB 268]|nr:hypothetical protein [Pseudonocardia cytotoxica]